MKYDLAINALILQKGQHLSDGPFPNRDIIEKRDAELDEAIALLRAQDTITEQESA